MNFLCISVEAPAASTPDPAIRSRTPVGATFITFLKGMF